MAISKRLNDLPQAEKGAFVYAETEDGEQVRVPTKTINGQSLLGVGDIVIKGGGKSAFFNVDITNGCVMMEEPDEGMEQIFGIDDTSGQLYIEYV